MVGRIPVPGIQRIENIKYRAGERQDRRDPRVQSADIRRERISFASGFQDTLTNTQDWTRGMGMSPSGRFRVIEETKPRKRMFSGEGIRWDAAKTLLLIVAAIMLTVVFVDIANIGSSDRQIRKLEKKVAALESRNESLENELALNTGDVNICTEAVKLNLVSSGGARNIQLTVPQNANMMLSQTSTEDNGEIESDRVASILVH